MGWLPDGEKISKISLFVLAQLTNVTDRQRDGHRVTAIAALCIASHKKNATINCFGASYCSSRVCLLAVGEMGLDQVSTTASLSSIDVD